MLGEVALQGIDLLVESVFLAHDGSVSVYKEYEADPLSRRKIVLFPNAIPKVLVVIEPKSTGMGVAAPVVGFTECTPFGKAFVHRRVLPSEEGDNPVGNVIPEPSGPTVVTTPVVVFTV